MSRRGSRAIRPTDPSERLVFFTDAVVAIALTLLVLPLVDLVPEARRSGLDLGGLLRENLAELGAFLLSFLVIFRFWWAHHQLFRQVSRLSRSLVSWNLLWLLSIVFLPWPTAIITAYPPSSGTVLLYTGTLVLGSGSLTLLTLTVHRDPALSVGRDRETREEVLGSVTSLVALLVALVLGSVFPGAVNYKALLLLFLGGPVEHLVKRRWSRHTERTDRPDPRERSRSTPGSRPPTYADGDVCGVDHGAAHRVRRTRPGPLMGHDHGHAHATLTATGRHRQRLVVVMVITLAVFVAEVVGGLLSGSLALLADAGHMLTDAAGLVIALIASVLAARPATSARTYGLQRTEVLAALVNGVLLVAIAGWVLVQAVQRWQDPAEVSSGLMLGVALVGIAANVVGLLVLRGGKDESLNLRGAYLEVLGDLVGSVAVVVAAVVILTTGWTRADPLASVLVVCLIVPRAWALIRDVVDVLLEATPRGVDLDRVRAHIQETPGVVEVHDLHVWTITSGLPVLSAHVVVEHDHLVRARSGEILDSLGTCLGEHFDVAHCTFQLEPEGHRDHEPVQHR